MHILILNWKDITHPLAGGAEVHLHETYSRIAARGHGITLFCSSYDGARPEESLDGMRVLRAGNRFLFNFTAAAHYRSRFRRERFDLIVDDVNLIPFCTPAYVSEPVLTEFHHLIGASVFRDQPLPQAAYVYLAERLSLPLYRSVHSMVHSESTRRELLAHGFSADRLHSAPLGIDHTRYTPSPSARNIRPMIAAIGRLKRYKAFDHLLEAMPAVLNAVPDATLTIAGQGDDRARLERITDTLGIRHAVSFVGHISEEEKVGLLQRAHVVVNTSIKEGWGLTVIEANACGTPTVCSDVPGHRDSVVDGRTGSLYPFGDRQLLADRIVTVLKDDDRRCAMTEAAIRHALQFDWQRTADATLDVMERLVDEQDRH